MRVSPYDQAAALLLCLAAGGGLGLLYDLLRPLRLSRLLRPIAPLLDLLFWLCVCLSLFLCALTLEDGRVRLYLILAQGTGGTLYLLLLSPAVRLGLGFLLRIPAIPLRIIRTSFRRIFQFLKKS